MDFLTLCITALCSVGALFLIAKIMGHKQIAQLDFFDYITGITIGSIAPQEKNRYPDGYLLFW